jgi:hypothetical protein
VVPGPARRANPGTLNPLVPDCALDGANRLRDHGYRDRRRLDVRQESAYAPTAETLLRTCMVTLGRVLPRGYLTFGFPSMAAFGHR